MRIEVELKGLTGEEHWDHDYWMDCDQTVDLRVVVETAQSGTVNVWFYNDY